MEQIHKYPRTHHIEGSRLQPGDEDLDSVPFEQIANRHIVIEEKVDGANCGISFTELGQLQTQSRGHYLKGGPREKHFSLLKRWATTHQQELGERLTDRYVMYGEWLYAKHTIFYDSLPHYFMEFDILDLQNNEFLSTPARQELLADLPITSVKVLFEGKLKDKKMLAELLAESNFISKGHVERLNGHAHELGLDVERIVRETDCSTMMEGLYIKVEENGAVTERYKFVRADFLTAVVAADSHWLNRPIVPNLLQDDVDIFS